MQPVQQTKFTTEDQTVHGNCFAACVASLLELSIDEVPTFETMGEAWGGALYEFLQTQGYTFLGTFYATDDPDWWQHLTERCAGVDGFYIVAGGSPRPHVKKGHCVIFQNGQMVHDPHPDGSGIKDQKYVMMIVRGLSH